MSNINQFIKSIILLISLSFLISCGSGSGSGSSGGGSIVISPPTNLKAVAANKQVSLTWDSTNIATTYNLYYAIASFDNLNNISKYGALVVNLSTNTYTITPLSNGIKYYFVITAVQNSKESKKSNEVSATPFISPPTNLSAVAGDTQVSLSWDSTNTTTYNLYYATASFANLNDISNYSALRGATLVANLGTNTYTTTSLTNGSKYYFVITAVQNSIESKGSNEVHATPQVVIINTSTTTLLNDMGITWGGDYTSGNNTTCTSNISAPQDCHQGRDAGLNLGNSTFTFVNGSGTTKIAKVGAGVAGFDFTRLNANGSTHTGSVYATSAWSCVRDNHTGLIWEVKTDKGSKSTDHQYSP